MEKREYDERQREVIDAGEGYHLVLAPPGCGKTEVLAERILRAHQRGVAYGDMLCLTFTNRASRSMRERIEQMVKYLEDNHFQVIYAAPPEKIGSIGEHITSTVSLINSGRYTKVVDGSVIFKSNEG